MLRPAHAAPLAALLQTHGARVVAKRVVGHVEVVHEDGAEVPGGNVRVVALDAVAAAAAVELCVQVASIGGGGGVSFGCLDDVEPDFFTSPTWREIED